MSKQDRQGVRSPTDIEQKYDLGEIAGLKKAVRMNETGLSKTNQTLEQFTNTTVQNFKEVQKELDGKAEIWFYKGIPTLLNEPANGWSEESYQSHVGDMYYDWNTGYAYRFKLEDGVFSWERVQDKDTVEALAKANAAVDTADSKRRVFLETPAPPYDNGDLWVHEEDIYVCQISKPETETYAKEDFILATNYTDDTYAKQVGDNLEIVRGTVASIEKSVDSVKIEFETTVKTINDLKEEVTENSKKIKYQFDTEEFTVSKEGADTSTHISENGMRVTDSKKENVLKADSNGVDAKNLHARTYLIIGNNSRIEDYNGNRTGVFWIGGN